MYNDIRLKEIREKNKLTQKEIANIINITENGYGQFERGHTIIPLKSLIILCDYYNVSVDYMLGFTSTTKYKDNTSAYNLKVCTSRLKEFRKENKLTQVKLAKFLNIGNGTIGDYERGRYLIATPFLYTICKKYHISADYLLGKIDYKPKL